MRKANLFAPSSNIIMQDVTLFFGLIFIEKKRNNEHTTKCTGAKNSA